MKFVPLHVYSGYSFLRSGLSIPKLLGAARKGGYDAVGLSDFETLSGYPEFFHALEKYQMTPVFGMDVEVDGVLVSLFLHDEEGYRNLIKIAYTRSKGEIDRAFLLKHLDGLSLVLPSEYSPIRQFYKVDPQKVVKFLKDFSVGIERFYIGLPYLPNEGEFASFLREFAKKYPYDLVAFPHILYAKKGDAIVLDIVRAIAEKQTLSEREKDGDNYFLTQEEAISYFSENEISLTETLAASSFTFLEKRGGLLHYPCPEGESASSYLRKLAYEGLKQRKPDYDEEYKTRLDYELDVIDKMG
ncbi:MAG: PHP domain-containing protein, partial [Bacilli bacterium]|nr:PHP domain-containing protein [Bacilli bacterium]